MLFLGTADGSIMQTTLLNEAAANILLKLQTQLLEADDQLQNYETFSLKQIKGEVSKTQERQWLDMDLLRGFLEIPESVQRDQALAAMHKEASASSIETK